LQPARLLLYFFRPEGVHVEDGGMSSVDSLAIRGFLADDLTGVGLGGLRVELWPTHGAPVVPAAAARSDDSGAFRLALRADQVTDYTHTGVLDVELRVFDRGRMIARSLREIDLARGGQRPPTIELIVPGDKPGGVAADHTDWNAADDESFDPGAAQADEDGASAEVLWPPSPVQAEVRGQVRGPTPEGSRVEAVLTTLSEQRLEEQVVAEAAVNATGWYRMKYTLPALPRPDGGAANATLTVRLRGNDGALVGESTPLLSPAARARADIRPEQPPGRASEYELLEHRVHGALAGGAAGLDGAAPEVIDEVAGWVDVDPDRLTVLQQARAREQQTGVPAPVFYALGRSGLGLDLEDLIDLPARELRTTVEEAVADGIIGEATLIDLDASLERLSEQLVDHALDPERPSMRPALGDILAAAGLPPERIRPVLDRYHARDGGGVEFWDDLVSSGPAAAEGLDEQTIAEMDLAVRAGGLLGPNPALLRRVHQMRREGRWHKLEDLTELEAQDWEALIEESGAGGTAEGESADEAAERIGSQARQIVEALEDAFPSAYIRRTLARGQEIGSGAQLLLSRAHDHNLVAHSIHARVQAEPALLEGLDAGAAERAVEEVAAVERVSRVTERAHEVAALIGTGIRSAKEIGRMPKRQFVELYSEELGGRPQAARVHAQAQLRAAAAKLAAIRLWQARQHVPRVLRGAPDPALKDMPDARTLFGSGSLCGCEHCASVYSPAAYFVDLLRYLNYSRDQLDKLQTRLQEKMREGNEAGARGIAAALEQLRRFQPLDALLARRPDLADLPLTCENTLTALPYIDLVNELLEAYATGGSAAFDTGKTPADVLRAVPQNVSRPAYALLEEAVYPTSMPYHQPLAQARAYLGHLGVTRLELLRVLGRGQGGEREAVLAEALSMSAAELHYVTTSPPELWRHFGFEEEHDDAGTRFSDVLAQVPAFLEAVGITFQHLIDLVSTRFVNADNVLALASAAPDCDPDGVRIVGLDDARLSRMLRLVRLERRVGWKLADLDRALSALGARELDLPTLEKLADAREAARRLDRPITELLVLWAPLDTWGTDNQFDRLLATRAVMWRLQDARTLQLRPDRAELVEPGESLEPVASALLAAFRITSEELALLRAIQTRRGAAPRLDVAGLSAIYRVLVLARALGLRIRQLDFLLRLAPPDADPFRTGDPAGTLRFIDLAREVQDSDFTPERLAYLFRHESEPGRDPGPLPAQVDAVLAGLRRSLGDAYTETGTPTEIAADTLRGKLALLLDPALLDPVVDALDPRTQVPTARRRELFDRHVARLFPDPAAAAERLFGAAGPTTAPPPAAPKEDEEADASSAAPAAPAQPPAEDPLQQRWRANTLFILEHLLPQLRARQLRGAVVQGLSDTLGLSAAATARLLDGVLRSRRAKGEPLMRDFMALLGTGLTGAYYGNRTLRGEPVVTRLDPELAFSWVGAPPADRVPARGWSARWTGHFLPRSSTKHLFYVRSDGAVRLVMKIDGAERVLIDAPGPASSAAAAKAAPVEHTSEPVALDPRTLYELRLEYRNAGAAGVLSVQVGTGPSVKQPLATTDLFPADGLASFAPVQESYRRLHKAALILTGLGVTDPELEWLTGDPPFLSLDGLPTQPPAAGADSDAVVLFQRWRQLAALHTLRRKLPRSNTELFDVFRARALPEALDRLASATGWERAVIDALIGTQGLGIDSLAALRPSTEGAEPTLVRLARAVDIQRRAGVSPETLFAWARATPDADMAAAIVQAVKARYDEKRWLEVARGLNDPLRAERRDALVAFLLPRMREQGVSNRNQLFEYFLIDVEMQPCMLTSRIRQAIATVQTFFQRSLMNLEPKVSPRLIDDSDWKWMKNYRVWEANRKVFLYPENWIEPELRDDKTPLFEELERSILQQEIKKENVEAAFSDYLQGLDEISRLDVRGVWFEHRQRPLRRITMPGPPQLPPWDEGTTHVFARTFNAPHVWYYRRLENARSWTPWEKIDADIDGDHLVPVIFQRRMHLFWTVFREANKPTPALKREDKGPPPKLGKDWEIQLAYSVYDRGRWSRKRLSSSGVVDRQSFIFSDEQGFQEDGSRVLAPADYVLRATIWGTGGQGALPRLAISLYCRNVDGLGAARSATPLSVAFADADVSLVGHFHLNGCNGSLDPDRAVAPGRVRRSATVARRALSVNVTSKMAATRGLQPFTIANGGVLPAPSGYRVDGMAFQANPGGGSLLSVRASDARGTGLVLQASRGAAPGAQVVPVVDPNNPNRIGLYPFFFQDQARSYFARPVVGDYHPPRLVPAPLIGRYSWSPPPRIAQIKPRPPARGKGGGRGRREDVEELEALDTEAELQEVREDAGEMAVLDHAEMNPEALDAWQDALDEVWHPDDAAEAKGTPPRPPIVARIAAPPRRPAPGRVAAPPAVARPPAPPPAPRLRVQAAFHEQRLRFVPFEHPSTCYLIGALKAGGIERLLDYSTSRPRLGIDHVLGPNGWTRSPRNWFQSRYQPGPLVYTHDLPTLDIDFGNDNPYAVYNWELFFHAPLQVAVRLAKDGRHEEAQRWFHFIFDPTTDASSPIPRRYWRFAPFHENDEYAGARDLMALLSYSTDDPAHHQIELHRQRQVLEQIAAWWEKPFSPHVIARLRTVAYQKAVVMKYIDNLIEWGDKLFRQDTMESIQEATQLYILASNILGPRPEQIPPLVEQKPLTFQQIREGLDVFSNFEVRIENNQVRRPFRLDARPDASGTASILGMATQYFCTPANPQLDKYWDTVADRLFKIRNCMNIQGVVRQLPLFEPPIDPGLLVRAAAAGVDLGSVIASLNAPPPHYRFKHLLARAVQMAEEVRTFGAATLKVLERKDAEGLAALRASNETALLDAVRDIRRKQTRQVEDELEQFSLQREHVDMQMQYLNTQLAQLMNPQEKAAQQSLSMEQVAADLSEGYDLVAKVVHAIPDFQTGTAGGFSSPFITLKLGGKMLGDIATAFGNSLQKVMSRNDTEADMAAAQADYQRRKDEWQQALDLLGKEKAQLEKKIAEIQLKLEISSAELRRHELEVDNSRKIESYLREKYTNAQLYGWMLGQLSGAYFQAYKLAFDAAQQAERAYRFERGEPAASFIDFSYWDSLKKGLFAGERLLLDLRRMEGAHIEGDRRALEITRHLSLREDHPLALAELLATGKCQVEVTEALLDGDFPGHYFRRFKAVSVSVVAPVGAHGNANCTLTLLENRIRTDANASGTYAQAEEGDDARFLVNFAPLQAVATSRPADDAGVFHLKFDDERYLPFEGAGAISTFRVELAQADNALDLSQVTDVVLTLSYTARTGGGALEASARASREKGLARGAIKPLPHHRVSVRRDLPELWQKLAGAKSGQEVEAALPLEPERMSGRYRGLDVRIERVTMFAQAKRALDADALKIRLDPPKGAGAPVAGWAAPWSSSRTMRATAEIAGKPGTWKLAIATTKEPLPELVDDLVLVFELRARKI
jgi:hypothetical protein